MESIGGRLRRARQEKNLTLEEVQKKTKIHPRMLKALEEDNAEQILNSTYIKGFLKIYADYLGLDGSSLVKEYVALCPVNKENKISKGGHPTPAKRTIDLKVHGWAKVASILKRLALILPILLIFILFFLSLRSIIRSRELKKSEEVKSPPEVTSKAKGVGSSVAKSELLKLAIRAKQDSWIQVKSDGKIVFQSVLHKGSSEKWEAKEKLELWVGNAGGIDLELNDKPLGPLGRGGVIKNILITREGMKVGK